MTEEEFRSGVLVDGTRLMQPPAPPIDHRTSIADWVERQAERRTGNRFYQRLLRILSDEIRSGFDLPDEPAPVGVRARYSDEIDHSGLAQEMEIVPTVLGERPL